MGSPARTGSATSPAAGSFKVTGGGEAIWGNADQFHYVYQPVQGNTEIVARVASLQVLHAGTKAGVMIRESMNAGARHASMFATGSNGWSFQYRDVTDGLSFTSPGPGGNAPGWVRLVRAGHVFTAYRSSDGQAWSLVGSETIAMSSAVYVGLAVSSRVASVTTSATFTNVTVGTTTPGGNKPPTVSIASPSSGATYNAPASMVITASASDSDGTVTRVDIYQGSRLLKSDTTVPYSVDLSGLAAGTYPLSAVARDNDGATTTSAVVNITVRSGTNQPPSVSVSAPASGASFTAPANIPLQAAASDSDGRVSRVEFYRGTTLIGADSTAPFAVTWTGAPVGTYTLTARAFDDDGASRTSAGVSVSVRSAQNQLPTVSVTSPSTGSAFTAPASVTINATARDADGTIVGVDFYVGSQIIGTDTTSPYSASWTNVPAGSYSLTARARDNSGGRGPRAPWPWPWPSTVRRQRHGRPCWSSFPPLTTPPTSRRTQSQSIAPLIPSRRAQSLRGTSGSLRSPAGKSGGHLDAREPVAGRCRIRRRARHRSWRHDTELAVLKFYQVARRHADC